MAEKDPRRVPTQERSRATVEAILVAVGQLAERDGLESVTMAAVAKRAGVSLGTLYQYFATLESVLAAWEERDLTEEQRRIIEHVMNMRARAVPARPAIAELVELGYAIVERRLSFYRNPARAELVSRIDERTRINGLAISAVAAALAAAPPGVIQPTDHATAARVLIQCIAHTAFHGVVAGLSVEARAAMRREVIAMVQAYLLGPPRSEPR